ncbi:MAG: ABC transporter substrate-binding protein [Spirochaetales bacterium]|nr:ABC transporter substrate-binding protein [Spirochaetales bacterium]
MNKKIIVFLIIAAMAVSAVFATPVAESTGAKTQPVVIKDMIGREVEVVPGSYHRVVCIGAGALRMYSYIGDVADLCGVEDIDNISLQNRPKMFDQAARPYVIAFSKEFSTLPSCGVGGPQAQTAEAEKILSCNPDIVISEYEDVQKEDALQAQLGIPVITLRSGADGVFADEFKASMKLLGVLFDKEERAKDLVSFIEKEQEEISRRTASVEESAKPAVYICGLGNWGTTNHLMTAQTYKPFEIAHIKNAVTGLSAKGIQAIEKEKFEATGKDMDIMVIDAAAIKNIKPLLAEDKSLFDSSKAWKNGNVYIQLPYNAYYTNYEIALINTWFLAMTAYPQLFEDINIYAKMDEITQVFLGLPLGDEILRFGVSKGAYNKIDTATFFN